MSRWIKGLLMLVAAVLVCAGGVACAGRPTYGTTYYYYAPSPTPYPYGVYYWRPPVVVGPGPVFVGPPIGMRPFIINPYGQGYRPVYVRPYRVWYGPYVW